MSSKPERKDIQGPQHPSKDPIITQEIKHPGGLCGGAQKPAQGQEEPKEEGKE